MAYKRRRKNVSGFKKYCSVQLRAVRSASKAGSRSKATLRYQKCLTTKHGIKSGYKGKGPKKS